VKPDACKCEVVTVSYNIPADVLPIGLYKKKTSTYKGKDSLPFEKWIFSTNQFMTT